MATYPTVHAAAEAIHLSQPALTKSIARFEDQLGAKLFQRRGRRLVLTEFGELMVQRGEQLLKHARELEEEVALWQGLGTGEVKVGRRFRSRAEPVTTGVGKIRNRSPGG